MRAVNNTWHRVFTRLHTGPGALVVPMGAGGGTRARVCVRGGRRLRVMTCDNGADDNMAGTGRA